MIKAGTLIQVLEKEVCVCEGEEVKLTDGWDCRL